MAAVGTAAVQGGRLLLHAKSPVVSLLEGRTQLGAQCHGRQANAAAIALCDSSARHVAARDGALPLCHAAPARGDPSQLRGFAGSSFALGSALQKCAPSTSASSLERVPRGSSFTVRAETKSNNLGDFGGQWLSCTTRHVRLYIGYIDPESHVMDQSQLDKISLNLDPDNEFVWTAEKEQKVYNFFTELLDQYEGAEMTEYTLRLIGSEIEHYIRKLLLTGEIKYNLNCRVLNYSMGKPRINPNAIDLAQLES
ncbi:hypothetical protein CBR_g26037 [Chara braunii]|uniref:NAD(P)H-quinone oxidoreductase subunit M, chloroplastic n=1 Tax=Chara braunii TaxID=69332 RepID=A0A388L709_CHABU|nr:hypothetical protein CBR_g26037 [Chara braunii]|eukprot:GBG78100.1 hypothetical protein CBR_g26037 [Chara braunii]